MKKDYHLRNIYAKDQAITQLGSHEDVTVINASPSMFYDMETFMNKLHEKYPPSTIMKSHYFAVHLDDPTSVRTKISSDAAEELVCNLMKSSRKRTKMLASPAPAYVQSALKDNIIGCVVKDIHGPDYDTPPPPPDDEILAVPATGPSSAGPPPPGPPLPGSPLSGPPPLGPPPPGHQPRSLPGPLLRSPPGPPHRKRKFAAATIIKAVTAAINKIIKNTEKRSKLLLEIQQKKQQRFNAIKAWDAQRLTPPGMQDMKQVDLHQKCRQFIPKTYQNEIFPKPPADKTQLIKSQ